MMEEAKAVTVELLIFNFGNKLKLKSFVFGFKKIPEALHFFLKKITIKKIELLSL